MKSKKLVWHKVPYECTLWFCGLKVAKRFALKEGKVLNIKLRVKKGIYAKMYHIYEKS